MSVGHPISHDMLYDGQKLQWRGHGLFGATSGLPGSQDPSKQCESEAGPIPEGSYRLTLREDQAAARIGNQCGLYPSWNLQKIPRGIDAGDCESTLANWGRNRIRLTPVDPSTIQACSTVRGGFYLHDSMKGFSHGCIEVEGKFFEDLRRYIAAPRNHAQTGVLKLLVKYLPGRSTNGGTLRA